MTALPELAIWEPQTTAEALDQTAAQLANRTAFLKAQLDAFTGALSVKNPAFGAVGDGIHDDTAAIALALTAAQTLGGARVLYPPGTYNMSKEVPGYSHTHVLGYGAMLRPVQGTRFRSFIRFYKQFDFKVEGLMWNLGFGISPAYADGDDPVVYNSGLRIEHSYDWTVSNCQFVNLYTNSLFIYECEGGRGVVEQCKFSSPAQGQTQRLEHIIITGCSAALGITRNYFDNAAPQSSANGVCALLISNTSGQVSITHNTLINCGRDSTGRHQVEAICFYLSSDRVVVAHNVVTGCLYGALRLSAVTDAHVHHNYFDMSPLANTSALRAQQMISIESVARHVGVPGTVAGTNRVRVHHNTFKDEYSVHRQGISSGSYDFATPQNDVRIDDNDFVGMNVAVGIGGPWGIFRIRKNNLLGNNGSMIRAQVDLNGTSVASAHGATERESTYKLLEISDNQWDVAPSGTVPIVVDFRKAPVFAGTIGSVRVRRNGARPSGTQATQFFAYRGPTGVPKGRVIVQDNSCENFSIAFDIAHAAVARIERNETLLCATPFEVSNLATCTQVIRRDNQFTAGDTRGRGTLATGRATVKTREILSGDDVVISRASAAGGLGHLSVANIIPGVSFDIISSSETETSTVFWEIVH